MTGKRGVDSRKDAALCMIVGCRKRAIYRSYYAHRHHTMRGYCSEHRHHALTQEQSDRITDKAYRLLQWIEDKQGATAGAPPTTKGSSDGDGDPD